ncbi:hypothetical protein BDB01DRAFT_809474 [Pilobolus umbonatus]|nr:hypothetical protein BDB01DRAFT_809474 [Pilobolus umbonatus]
MPAVQWKYAMGSHWVPFEESCNRSIERLWQSGRPDYINCRSFGNVYINISRCELMYQGDVVKVIRTYEAGLR